MVNVATPGFYAAHRPVVVVDSLSDLRGPVTGTVTTPIHLHWGPWRTYDLANADRVVWLYSRTLREAGEVADIASVINREVLTKIWPNLVLPVAVKDAWEARFPALAERRWYGRLWTSPNRRSPRSRFTPSATRASY